MAECDFDYSAFLEDMEWVRQEEGMSKRSFAEMLGVSNSTYVELSTKGRTPPMQLVISGLRVVGQDFWVYVKEPAG